MNLPSVAADVRRRIGLIAKPFRLLTSAATSAGFVERSLFHSDLLTAHEPQRRNAGFPTGKRADWKVGVTNGRSSSDWSR